MVVKRSGERRLYVGVVVLVVLMIGLVVWFRRPVHQAVNQPANTTARATYASLYDSLWRQDSGQGSVLMTATLFVPPMITALGDDTQRSDVEEQIWNRLKNNNADQVGVFVTLDSVSGFLTDDEISKALTLTASSGPTFQLTSWQPLIGTSSPVNANVAVTSQRGLAIFSSDVAVEWPTLNQVTLRATGLADQPVRQFVWTQVGSISE